MHRAAATRQWLCRTSSPGPGPGSQVRRRSAPSPLSAQRPPSYPRVAKLPSATLGVASPGAAPARERPSSSCMTSPPAIYSSRPAHAASHLSSTQPRSETTRTGLAADPALHVDSVAAVDAAKQQLLGSQGIPSEQAVLRALLQCDRAARRATTRPSATQPTGKAVDTPPGASSLLSLDVSTSHPPLAVAAEVSHPGGPSDQVEHISQVAFDLVTHPKTLLTPPVLEAYVVLQARLGSLETLPHVLGLYASKPRPQETAGSINWVPQNPHRAAAAVPPSVIEKALDAAMQAKNLDAAVGIIESTYATKAFLRQKLLRRALVPVSLAATAPMAVYLLASHLAHFQSSFDHKTATALAAAGILAYVGVTGSLGLLAFFTHNDHMSRVTWAPGTSLRQRWLLEDQRAAFDKVACSFGFSQSHRFGEEEGEEIQVLRQFLLRKGMILDSVELMEGMT